MERVRLRAAVCAPILCVAMAPLADAGSSALERMSARLQELRDELIEVRRDLHRHPEPSGEEERTAGVVAERLRALGLDVRTGVGGHGVVAVLRGGRPGPTVGYRADMDAVPSPVPDPVAAIASVNPGIRHICGHDIHTTVGLGVAEALAAVRDELPGTVKLLFQPSEENARGARAMIADGALEAPTPEAIFAVHTAPLPAGQIGAVEGLTLVGRDLLTVRVSGEGDREAATATVNRVLEEASTVAAPRSFPELAAMPQPEGEFILGHVLRSDEDQVVGQVMTSGRQSSRRARQEIERRLKAASTEELAYEPEYQERYVAGVYSDPELVRRTHASIRAALGEDGLVVTRGAGPGFSEDFGSFLEDIPGAMFWLGVSNQEKGLLGMPHHPNYGADEDSILAGALAMAAVLYDYLAGR